MATHESTYMGKYAVFKIRMVYIFLAITRIQTTNYKQLSMVPSL